jgi:hypothetical protein
MSSTVNIAEAIQEVRAVLATGSTRAPWKEGGRLKPQRQREQEARSGAPAPAIPFYIAPSGKIHKVLSGVCCARPGAESLCHKEIGPDWLPLFEPCGPPCLCKRCFS